MVDFTSLIDNITPGSDKKNKSLQKKILNLFFPKFSWRTFTFYWGIIWAGLNAYLVIMENFSERYVNPTGVDITKSCRIAMFGGSISPAIKYKKHFHRLILGPFLCDNIMQVLIGLYVYWSYGFLFEKHYGRTVILVVTFGATLMGSLVGAFWEFNLIRAQGTCHVIAWCLTYVFLLWEKLNYNIIWFIMKMVIMVMKTMAVLMSSLTEYGDPIGTVATGIFTMVLGLSLLKEVSPRFDEEKKFILMRLKIFLFIISITIFVFSFSYVAVMYDNRTNLNTYNTVYACNKTVTQNKVAPVP